jgi:hypothetical protein
MDRRFLLAPAVIVAALLVTTGCGSSGSKSAGPLSKADLAKTANGICSDGTAKLNAVGALRSLADVAAHGDAALQLKRDYLAKLEQLTPPAGLKSALDDLISIGKKRLAANEAILSAAKKGDAAAFERLATADHSASDAALASDATTIGAPACGR